jgi:uncharacterized protein YegP (UPF0339 family)
MKFEIFEAERKFRWRLVDERGTPIAVSEGFTWKQDSVDSVAAVRAHAGVATVHDLTEAPHAPMA